MVKICQDKYDDNNKNNEKYKEYFSQYSYPLHNFQKHAIEAIVENQHILITAHTGSGKTLPGEFAIQHHIDKGKKVIYTTPIKALSNQKYYDFTNKYPHISFGVLTGDLKCNPDADCLIMTTEILLNKLYQLESKTNITSNVSFEMDIQNELACVIFDEVHYINDQNRGNVWEQSIMMLPKHVQMVMLSATIDNPKKFAEWCESRNDGKTVHVATNLKRAVPLTHYGFITVNNSIFKIIKDKAVHEEIRSVINKPWVIKDSTGEFKEAQYFKIHKILNLFEKNRVFVKRAHILNELCKYLKDNLMLPALCFVFSRKQIVMCAKEITTILLEDDSKIPYIVRNECDQIMRKFPNFAEYLELPEYNELIALLEKGIGIHHAGMLAPFREIVELLFSKGYIKLLFCTETLSIGINMPVKTTIFTSLQKYDGDQNRYLYSHEYTQSAGRAGRLGIDTVGNVIHLNNLFRNMDCVSYKKILSGNPQTLISKFKLSYNLILNMVDMGISSFDSFTEKSMIYKDVKRNIDQLYNKILDLQDEVKNSEKVVFNLKSPFDILKEYSALYEERNLKRNNKTLDTKISKIEAEYYTIKNDIQIFYRYMDKLNGLINSKEEYLYMKNDMSNRVIVILDVLIDNGFVVRKKEDIDQPSYELTLKGQIACHLREMPCLIFATWVEEKKMLDLNAKQWTGIMSCLTNVSIMEECKLIQPATEDKDVLYNIKYIIDKYKDFVSMEEKCRLDTGTDYNLQYDLVNYVMEWCDCETAEECKYVLQKLESEKTVSVGEFVKALLKINNMASEMEKVAELIGDISFLSKMREVPKLTLKFVATNQSLYV
jgi:superfamily II RNA helicase